MDDEGGGRALPRRLFIFVGPAAVIGHRPAAERAFEPFRLPVGVVDQDDHRLAADVEPGIIVPAALGRVDAVADEDDLAILDADARLGAIGGADEIGAIGEADSAPRAGDLEPRAALERDLDQRHVLGPAAIVARPKPGALEFPRQQGDCALLAFRPRRAALEVVGRQFPGDALERRQRDLRLAGAGRGRSRLASGDEQSRQGNEAAHRRSLLCRSKVAGSWHRGPACATLPRGARLPNFGAGK